MKYEAIAYLTQMFGWLLIITPFGAGAMCTYQAVRKALTQDEEVIEESNRLIKNTVKGAVVIMTISGLVEAIKLFYL